MSFWKKFAYGFVGLAALGAIKKVLPERHHYEEPSYRLLQQGKGYEIRRYESRLELVTETSGEYREELNNGFRVLGNYIFGGNAKEEQIAMTTPVGYKKGELSFVVPSERGLESLPDPNDSRVQFRTVEAQTVAVRRFTGWCSEEVWQREKQALLRELDRSDITVVREPILAQYDPPWTVPFLRRNEVLVGVQL